MSPKTTLALLGKPSAIMLVLCAFSHSFAQINTPQDLKTACETSAGNVVTLAQSAKVSAPATPATPLLVNCPCTIVLTNGSTIEFEHAHMQFVGALSIQSVGNGEAKLVNSILSAPSASFTLGGNGSQMNLSKSKIQATAGNLTIVLGAEAKSEMHTSFSPTFADGLSATGVVNISAGQRFQGSLAEMTVSGNAGVNISLSGMETLLKVEKVSFKSSAGSISIGASGMKGLLEMKEAKFFSFNQTNLLFNGVESTIKINQTGFYGPTLTSPSLGGVAIAAGSGTASLGKVELGEITTGTIGGAFTIKASAGGSQGGVKLEKSTLTSNGAMLFETGAIGSTEVKENSLTSGVKITIKTGLGGNCVAAPNTLLSAPVVEACLPATALMGSSSPYTPHMPLMPELFPNPGFGGSIHVKFGNLAEEVHVRVMDLQGRMLQQMTIRDQQWRIDGLQPGFYYLQTIDKATGVAHTQKFVIAN